MAATGKTTNGNMGMRLRLGEGDALLVVDVQNDFLPGGRLAVPHGDAILPPLRAYLALFRDRGLPVVATRDWHPADHCSFTTAGGPWPPHCMANTKGADFPEGLGLEQATRIVSKATDRDRDAYSGFAGTGLDEALTTLGIRRLFVGGLATDYCVLQTVLDALERGYEVRLLCDAIRPVDVEEGDGARALSRMVEAGARPTRLEMIDVDAR